MTRLSSLLLLGDGATGSNVTVDVPAGALTLTGFAPTVSTGGGITIAVPAGSLTLTGQAPRVYVLDGRFERGSVNAGSSAVSGVGDAAVITLRPRMQNNAEYNPGVYHWQSPTARITGVNGTTPTFRFDTYPSTSTSGYRGYPWAGTRKPMYSYDGRTWARFDNVSVVDGSYIQFSNNTAFTGDTVYVSRERCWTVTQTGEWIAALAASYPTLVGPTPTAAAFTPVNCTSFPAQSHICAEYSAQTDELSKTVPAVPLYGFKISDPSFTNPKRAVVFTSGVHACEDTGNWVCKAAVEFLLSGNALALKLREAFDFFVYPLLNAPGRYGGHYRSQWEEGTGGADDLNRHFSDAVAPIETVSKPRTAIAADLTGHAKVWIATDFHGMVNNSYGFYDDATAAHDAQEAAIETRLGTQLYSFGASIAGFTNLYFRDTWDTDFYLTYEVGDATPLSDADVINYGESLVEAYADLLNGGYFGFEIAVPKGDIYVTGIAPDVQVGGNKTIDVPAGSLTLTGYTPVVLATGTITIDVPAGSLAITGFAPVVLASGTITIDVPVGLLVLTAIPPTVVTVDPYGITPPERLVVVDPSDRLVTIKR